MTLQFLIIQTVQTVAIVLLGLALKFNLQASKSMHERLKMLEDWRMNLAKRAEDARKN